MTLSTSGIGRCLWGWQCVPVLVLLLVDVAARPGPQHLRYHTGPFTPVPHSLNSCGARYGPAFHPHLHPCSLPQGSVAVEMGEVEAGRGAVCRWAGLGFFRARLPPAPTPPSGPVLACCTPAMVPRPFQAGLWPGLSTQLLLSSGHHQVVWVAAPEGRGLVRRCDLFRVSRRGRAELD